MFNGKYFPYFLTETSVSFIIRDFQHALTVEAVMKWYANELGYGITVGCGTTIDVEPEHEMEKVLFAAGCSR